jgi:disulfide bond formation protein DsbB
MSPLHKTARFLNSLIVLIISGVLLGAFGVQIFEHEQPCPLCLLQRVCMISVATGCLMNLKFGIQMKHYALCLLSSLLGGSVALRQISLHVCPTFSTFGIPVLGLSLYTWSFLIFTCVVFAVSLLLFLYRPEYEKEHTKMNLLETLTFTLIFLVTIANVFATFYQCGWGPCED